MAVMVLVLCAARGDEMGAESFPTGDAANCLVCEAAVWHVWRQAVSLRQHCRSTRGRDRDDRCDFTNLHPWAVDQMVWGVCASVGHEDINQVANYEITVEGYAARPAAWEAVVQAAKSSLDGPDEIKRICEAYFHGHHGGAERLGSRIQEHLEAGHNDAVDGGMQMVRRELCSHTCDDARRTHFTALKKQRENAVHRRFGKRKWEPIIDDEF